MKTVGWTADFNEFKQKVESVFGPLDKLAKKAPDVYAHQVLSHGFMEYVLMSRSTAIESIIKDENYYLRLKQIYLKWARDNKLQEDLLELGWQEYLND